MTENPLEGEISASVELTETGAKGALKSRLANAIDWAAGTWVLSKFQGHSNKNNERAAISDARTALIKESGEIALAKLRENPELAAPFIMAEFGIELQRAENRAAAIENMIEDIKANPPSEEESSAGPEKISDDTLNRWGRYAEDASSEELRERWGKVLSAEVRRPGFLSPKVMRIIDEIDTETAKAFEEFCNNSITGVIPKCLSGDLSFRKLSQFIQADLVIDPNISGHVRNSVKTSTKDGVGVTAFYFEHFAFAWPETTHVPFSEEINTFKYVPNGIAIPVYILTDAGNFLHQLFPTDEEDVFTRLAKLASDRVPKGDFSVFRKVDGDFVPMSIVGINSEA